MIRVICSERISQGFQEGHHGPEGSRETPFDPFGTRAQVSQAHTGKGLDHGALSPSPHHTNDQKASEIARVGSSVGAGPEPLG